MKKIKKAGISLYCKAHVLGLSVKETLKNKDGSFIEDAGKMLIGVVIAMLFLVFLYLLFKNTVFPNTTTKINDMYNYAG